MASFVSLREVIREDLPTFFADQQDPEGARMADFPSREWEPFMAHWSKILSDESCITRTVLFHGQVAGNIGAWPQSGLTLVGYWIGKSFWGKGIATAALAEFLGQMRVRPLHARVSKQNVASFRVLEKCGFEIAADEGQEYLMKLRDNPSDDTVKGRP